MREASLLAFSGIFTQGNVGCFKRVCRGLILLYHRLTVQPGMAMTVKEWGPVICIHRPLFIFEVNYITEKHTARRLVGVMTCVDAVKRFMGWLQQAG
jgi:hypothetical protein